MTRSEFVTKVAEIADERPTYRLGGDGSDDTCDCVGLCIGALRRGGIEYDYDEHVHGSNHVARHDAVELWRIDNIGQLRVGDCVLKAREPGDSRWDLPDYYKGHPDRLDYYHIGVVTSVDPLRITHMTSPTAKVDTRLGSWEYAMLLKQIHGHDDEREGEQEMQAYHARVKLTRPELDGNGLVVCNAPDGEEIAKLEHGTVVTVQAMIGKMAFVSVEGGPMGYVTARYLERIEEPEEETPEASEAARVQIVITDEAGQVFRPVGECTMDVEIIVKS